MRLRWLSQSSAGEPDLTRWQLGWLMRLGRLMRIPVSWRLGQLMQLGWLIPTAPEAL